MKKRMQMLVAAVAVLATMAMVCLANPVVVGGGRQFRQVEHVWKKMQGVPVSKSEHEILALVERGRARIRQYRDECLGMMFDIQGFVHDIKYDYGLLPVECFSRTNETYALKAQKARELMLLWEVSRDEVGAIKTMSDSFISIADFIELYSNIPDDMEQLMNDMQTFRSGVEKMRDILSARAKRALALRKSVVGIGGDVRTK